MIMAIANPFGGAIGDLVAPAIVSDPSQLPKLLLVIAIVSTAVFPFSFLVLRRPPTPPTKVAEARAKGTEAGSGVDVEWRSLKALVGLGPSRNGSGIGWRERTDFWIIAFVSALFFGAEAGPG